MKTDRMKSFQLGEKKENEQAEVIEHLEDHISTLREQISTLQEQVLTLQQQRYSTHRKIMAFFHMLEQSARLTNVITNEKR